MKEYERCAICKVSYPEDILWNDICGICALEQSNQLHGFKREKFDGEMNEQPPTLRSEKDTIETLVDRLDAEIMDWFYEMVKINFGVDMAQDSSDLRAILERALSQAVKEAEERG